MSRTRHIFIPFLLALYILLALSLSVCAASATSYISALNLTSDARCASVSLTAPEDCSLIVALYNADDRMLDSVITPVSGKETMQTALVSFPAQSFSYAKAFLVDPDTYSPVSDSIKITEPFGRYMVQFLDADESSATVLTAQVAIENAPVSCPPFPTKDGYVFNGWYTSSALTEPYDFSTPVTGHKTLYAGWLAESEAEVSDEELNQVLQCTQHIRDLTADYLFSGHVPQEELDAVLALVENYALQLKEQGIITYISRDSNSVYMEFSCLIPYAYSPPIAGMDSSGSDTDILMVDPFGNETDAESGVSRGYHAKAYGQVIESVLGEADTITSSYSDDAVDLDELSTLPDCEHLIWHGHGGNIDGYSHLVTGQAIEDTSVLRTLWHHLNKKHCLITKGGWQYSNREMDHLAVRSAFFRDKVQDGDFRIDGGLVYLATCQSATNLDLPRTFLDLGADVVFGNAGPRGINTGYDQMMLNLIINYMCAQGPKLENGTITDETDPRFYTASQALTKAHEYMSIWFPAYYGVAYPHSSYVQNEETNQITPHPDVNVIYYGAGDFTIVPGMFGTVYSSDNSVDLSRVTLKVAGADEISAPMSREEFFYIDKLTPGTYTLNCYYDGKLLKTVKDIHVAEHRYTFLGAIDLKLSTLDVTVLNEENAFLTNAQVTVTAEDDTEETAVLTMLEDGSQVYRLRTIPGTYEITVTHENYAKEEVSVTLGEKQSVTATLSAFCTITFDPNGGACDTRTHVVQAGYMAGNLPIAVRADHTFKGWNTASDGSGVAFTATSFVLEDLTVYAIWETPDNVPEDLYHIASALDESQVVTVMDCSTEENYNIQMWAAADLYDYTFYVSYVSDGYYQIISRYSGKVVTILDNNIVQATYTGADTQLWKFVSCGDGRSHYIVSKHSGLYLSMDGDTPQNHVNVIPKSTGGLNSQQWRLISWE